MKWQIIDKSYHDRGWSEWFAWYPVKTEENTKVWLEKVVRKQTGRTKNWIDWLFLDFFSEHTYKESVFQILKDGNDK